MEYYLDEVRDTHDLVWQAHYSAYGSPNATSAPRLVRVEYTFLAGASLDPVGATRVVDLTWEARPDGEPEGVEGVEGVTLNYGFMLTTDRRLASAEVSLDDGKTIERIRKYVFTYTNSGDSDRSQLNHVQMFGTTDIESLPEQTFSMGLAMNTDDVSQAGGEVLSSLQEFEENQS